MAIAFALPLAYVVATAGFFAWIGKRSGGLWTVVPLVLGALTCLLLATLWLHQSALLTPVSILAVFSPVAVAFANRSTGYRWWPSFAMNRSLVMVWLGLGGLLLLGSLGVLMGLASLTHR
jgi:hypothetical protein